jgi:NAD(P)-dependent dehydrogenase (short-subunit alcohol dehydrogenase family)
LSGLRLRATDSRCDITMAQVGPALRRAGPAFLVCKHAMPHLDRGASVIITSSVVGLTADPGICAYATAKHALVGLMRTLAKEPSASGSW